MPQNFISIFTIHNIATLMAGIQLRIVLITVEDMTMYPCLYRILLHSKMQSGYLRLTDDKRL